MEHELVRVGIDVGVLRDGYFPVVATMCGFVLAGADITERVVRVAPEQPLAWWPGRAAAARLVSAPDLTVHDQPRLSVRSNQALRNFPSGSQRPTSEQKSSQRG